MYIYIIGQVNPFTRPPSLWPSQKESGKKIQEPCESSRKPHSIRVDPPWHLVTWVLRWMSSKCRIQPPGPWLRKPPLSLLRADITRGLHPCSCSACADEGGKDGRDKRLFSQTARNGVANKFATSCHFKLRGIAWSGVLDKPVHGAAKQDTNPDPDKAMTRPRLSWPALFAEKAPTAECLGNSKLSGAQLKDTRTTGTHRLREYLYLSILTCPCF